ncbi:MAG: hypothetical protein ACYCTI_07245 [Acidimicrobiales bacterium]
MSAGDEPAGRPRGEPERTGDLPFTRLDSGSAGEWWQWILNLDPLAPATVPTGPGTVPAPPETAPGASPRADPVPDTLEAALAAPIAPTPRESSGIDRPGVAGDAPSRGRALANLAALTVVLGVTAALTISAAVLVLVALFGQSSS